MKKFALLFFVFCFLSCSKKKDISKYSDYLINESTWIKKFDENYYAIGKPDNGVMFLERIYKINKKKYSIFLIQFTKRKKNEIYDKYKLRVDDLNGNVIYDTICCTQKSFNN